MEKNNDAKAGENKRAETDCQSVDNDCGHRGDEAAKRNEDYEWLLLGLNDGDDSLEKVLHNLDNIQSKVLSLKTKLSKDGGVAFWSSDLMLGSEDAA
ncbi:uncharacterized protein A4U43_C09F16030 [Asparagus officinalis]|uniref:Uncharacterized protein n=1 Tax=Asparagus officinalis TaxID=4686 RepID=A0A5P1ECS7_ASPOF|nr:uncharacterized protein A4U43_C09F16030 [Asparagus officinalis]